MRRDNINYLAVGVFVIVMVMAMFVTLYRITGRSGPADQYHVFYSNVSGIKYGTGVFYEGYQVGQVEAVTPAPDPAGGMRYRIDFSVQQGWQIPADSVAKIIASGLLAAVSIEIDEGDSKRSLAPGDEIPGQDQVNLFSAISDIAAHFGDLSDRGIKPVLKNLDKRISELSTEYTDLSATTIRPFIDALRGRIDDEAMWKDLATSMASLRSAAEGLQGLVDEESRGHVKTILANVSSASADLDGLMTRIEETRLRMNMVLEDLDGVVIDNRDQLRTTLSGASGAMEDLEYSLEEISDHIDAVMYHLEGSARNVNEFTRYIRENPGALIRGSDRTDGQGEQP